jgi:transcriptional regulator with XRE-family HTH domain
MEVPWFVPSELGEVVASLEHHSLSEAFWARRQERRALRRLAALTQADLAERVGTNPTTITRWETGTRRGRGRHAERYRRIMEQLEAAAIARFHFLATLEEYRRADALERPRIERRLTTALARALETDTDLWPISFAGGIPL